MQLEILYQCEHYIAVNKPAGMLVHRSWLDTHETVFLMQTLRDQIGQHVYPLHRLDRPTSGVILLALSSDSARRLAIQFEQQQIQKHYLAIVRGWTPSCDTINYPLQEQLDAIADQQADHNKAAQTAITHYQTLAHSELPFPSHPKFPTSRYSLICATPQTGRKHQIRRHLKHIFHPIIGDTTHGDLRQNQAVRQFCGNNRLLLHAQSLSFQHPFSQQTINISAPTDSRWQQVCQDLQLQHSVQAAF